MKGVIYEGKRYNVITLIEYYFNEDLKGYKKGDVYEVDGVILIGDISDLFNIYLNEVRNWIEDSKNFSSYSNRMKIRRIYENEIINLKIKEYEKKLELDIISLVEIEEWIGLMDRKEKNEFCVLKYKNFIVINGAKPKPPNLSYSDYGKFFDLIYIMNFNNEITYNNGRAIKRKELSELLEFKTISGLDKFILRLKKHNMVVRTEPNNKNISFLMVNPVYAMRKIEIDLTVYNYFKEDLIEFLNPLEKKYIELKQGNSIKNGILPVLYNSSNI